MKKGLLFGLALVLSLVGVAAYAQAPAEEMAQTIQGTIIDNMCAGTAKDNMAEFIKTHTKECALMPDCVKSGYSIYADGNLQKFDAESNAKIEEFLKKEESKLDVVVTVKKTDDMLSLVSIENQK